MNFTLGIQCMNSMLHGSARSESCNTMASFPISMKHALDGVTQVLRQSSRIKFRVSLWNDVSEVLQFLEMFIRIDV